MSDSTHDESNTARIRKGDLEVEFVGESMHDAVKGATCAFDNALENLYGRSFSTDTEIEYSDGESERIARQISKELRPRGFRK